MKLAIFIKKKSHGVENNIIKHIAKGLKKLGYELEVVNQDDLIPLRADLYVLMGLVLYHKVTNIIKDSNYIYIDKAYTTRGSVNDLDSFVRVSVNAFQPTNNQIYPEDRIAKIYNGKIGKTVEKSNGNVLIINNSDKYTTRHNLGTEYEFAQDAYDQIKQFSNKKVICKMKTGQPQCGWQTLTPLDLLWPTTAVAVSHGSNGLIEAQLNNIPTICLGEHPVSRVSRTSIEDIEIPRVVEREEKIQLLAMLSYHQWLPSEMGSSEFVKMVDKKIWK